MAKPLSPDLRKRVIVAVVEGGMSRPQAAARFNVGVATVVRWVARAAKKIVLASELDQDQHGAADRNPVGWAPPEDLALSLGRC